MKKETPENNLVREAIREVLDGYRGEIRWDEAIAPYTSLKVGGPADALVFPGSVSEIAGLMKQISKARIPCFILGRGSNLLVRDGGIKGIVIHLKNLDKIEAVGEMGLRAEGGVSFPRLALYAVEKGLSGLEFAIGIPGSVGGSVAMNAGIPEAETASYLAHVTLLDREGNIDHLTAKEIDFGYRRSGLEGNVLVAATFNLRPAPREKIETKLKQYLKRRQETQPLDRSNCGSVFKNPTRDFAGRLIEQCGLRGYQVGDAAISDQHANFMVNQGNASAENFLALIEKMKKEVFKRFEISLELEVKIVGRA